MSVNYSFNKIIIISILSFIFFTKVYSNQENDSIIVKNTNSQVQGKTIKNLNNQTDFIDIIHHTLHLNQRKDSGQTVGLGPFFSLLPAVGYTLVSGITGAITTSTSFYTDDNKNKTSNILANAYYSQYNQFWTNINSSIFIDKYKVHFFGDWRFYKFPTYTYGIGPNSSLTPALPIDYSYIRLYQFTYHEFFDNIFFGIAYNLDLYWDITTKVDTGKIYNEFIKKVKKSRSISSGISVNFLYDTRKNSVNPRGGTYVNVQYRPNMTLLGSDINWQSLLIDIRQFVKFPAASDNVLAFWSYNDLTMKGEPAYLDLPSIGWDDYNNTGRGYVQGRYRGNNLLYLESEYRFHITDNGLLGGVVFGNAETIHKKLSTELHTVIPGYGVGLRVKLNKKSDTNVCIDYGLGIDGSHGFFFNLGEVF